LPVLAALAPQEVRRGEWPLGLIVLAFYPAAALLLTAIVLLVEAAHDLRSAPFDALRGATVAVATGLYLFFAYHDPAFAQYRRSLPALYLVETLTGFLLGSVSRTR